MVLVFVVGGFVEGMGLLFSFMVSCVGDLYDGF